MHNALEATGAVVDIDHVVEHITFVVTTSPAVMVDERRRVIHY